MAAKDPDEAIVAIFKNLAIKNEAKSTEAGRPVFDDIEACEIHRPGSQNFSVHPATSFSHWQDDPLTGEQTPITYAERFSRQYRQFKAHSVQTKSGTPLEHAPFLTEARRAELRAQNIYTVEALASIDGQELKNLGFGGRELKNGAMQYIEDSLQTAPNLQLQAEVEALRARNALLEEDVERIKARAPSDEIAAMSMDELSEYITAHTGHKPHGSLNRKTLERMAQNARDGQPA